MHLRNASSRMTQTDQYLLDLALRGDADSFGRLVERWQSRVFGFILRYTGDREDARDLTQDTFAKAYQNLGRLSDPTSFPAWVYKIALNECRMRFRRSKRLKQVDLDEGREMVGVEVDERTPETAYRQTELQRVFESVFEELPGEQRAVIVMKEYQGLKFREIAEILDVPLSTVKSRLYLGLKALKVLVERSYDL